VRADVRLRPHIDMRTLRPSGAEATPTSAWRSAVRRAQRGEGGLLVREWRSRVGKDLGDDSGLAATQRLAAAAPPPAQLPTHYAPGAAPVAAPGGPLRSTRHATAAHLAIVASGGAVTASFDGRCMPAYRLHAFSKRSVEHKRLELRTASRLFGGDAVGRNDAPSGAGGLLWGAAVCPTCPGDVTADAAHFISACPTFEATRRACLTEACARAKSGPLRLRRLHECFTDVAAALHTREGRDFVLLAALGTTVADPARCELPVCWAECFEPPHRSRDGVYHTGAATIITFRAFEPLVVAVAAALPAAAAVAAGAAAGGAPPAAVGAPLAPTAAAAGPPQSAVIVAVGATGPGPAIAPAGPPAARDTRIAAVIARLVARPRLAAAQVVAGAAAAAAAAPARVISIAIDVIRPSPADVALRENLEDEDFSDKDPRRFNFRRAWSNGDDDVVAATDAGNWSSAEFRSFVWGNADGRGDNLFRLIGTLDLVNEFDPTR